MAPQVPPAATPAASIETDSSGYPLNMWGGRFRGAPETYKFPTGGPLKMIMDLLLFGSKEPHIRPMRQLHPTDFRKESRSCFSKAQKLFVNISEIAVNHGHVVSLVEFGRLSVAQWDAMFPALFNKFMESINSKLRKNVKNPASKSYVTLYDFSNK
jgi:hypothetical protein